METYFASPERTDEKELKVEIEFVTGHPVVCSLLNTVSGLIAVLNENRQIISVNEKLMEWLGVSDIKQILGLRPGEAVNCIYSNKMPGGCGTSEFCITCGAAIAIVSSLGNNRPVEKNCAVTVDRGGEELEVFLRVQACPINFDKRQFILLFLQDITKQQQLANLERAFFHDISNIVSGLMGMSELLQLQEDKEQERQVKFIRSLTQRLAKEVEFQRCLIRNEMSYNSVWYNASLAEIFNEIDNMFSVHPSALKRKLSFPQEVKDISFKTDFFLLLRVLSNMIINAFEATEEGGEVKLWTEDEVGFITFCVWNKSIIAPEHRGKIFHRNFSTKAQTGRGVGTFSMKMFGEKFLGGKVDFTSDTEGTVFRLTIPV